MAEQLARVVARGSDASWANFVELAQYRISVLQTNQLDRSRARLIATSDLPGRVTRLAVLGSSTVDHLLPSLRVGGLRRSIPIETYTPNYGQYVQELLDPASNLHRFEPNTILFALDAHHLMQGISPGMTASAVMDALDRLLDQIENNWQAARHHFSAHIIQNIPIPLFLPTLGNNEHRLPGSRLAVLRQFTALLRTRADAASVDVVALDDRVALDGLSTWHDPALWHRSKQEIHPRAAPFYGDLVARLTGAAQGRSSKCLVLDLDNTLWGGVIGDDGLAGIKLGQGSARGEAHLAFQQYCKDLSRRGVILAVCSKNDEVNALEPFLHHPEMVLKREDISCFVANWTDKAANLREIASRLNIGIESLVFADDNPAERAIVRQELPMVAVPELPEDPTLYAACLADAGYFEAVRVTAEDGQRVEQYRQNAARETLQATVTDMATYLQSLEMAAIWGHFDEANLTRVVQLINKTNQFNLTTRRVNETEIRTFISDPFALTLQIRLLDRFGDNGIIAIVIGNFEVDRNTINVDVWLMSCRVLGRGMEDETLNLIVAESKRLGAKRLQGIYRPSLKNGMVRDLYERLGFVRNDDESTEATVWMLDLTTYVERHTYISSQQAPAAHPAALVA